MEALAEGVSACRIYKPTPTPIRIPDAFESVEP